MRLAILQQLKFFSEKNRRMESIWDEEQGEILSQKKSKGCVVGVFFWMPDIYDLRIVAKKLIDRSQ